MKIPFSRDRLMELTQELYSSFFSFGYIYRKLISIRSLDDMKFIFFSAWKLIGHLLDFDKDQTKVSFWSFKFWRTAWNKLSKNTVELENA